MNANTQNEPWLALEDGVVAQAELLALIEERVAARRAALGEVRLLIPTFQSEDHLARPAAGRPYSYTLFKHLANAMEEYPLHPYRAEMADTGLGRLPLVGGWWRKVQQAGHQLVLFYVNKLIARQAPLNRSLTYALNELIDRNAALEARAAALESRLRDLEKSASEERQDGT